MADDGATFVFDTNIEDVVNRIVAGLEKVQRTVSNEGGAATSKLTSNLPRDIGIIVGDAQVQIDKLNKALSAGTLKGSLTKGYQGVVTDLNKAIGRITAGRGLTLDVGLKFATGPIKELIKSLQTQLAAAANSTNKVIASKAGSGVLQNRTVDFTAGAKAGDAANKEYAKQVRKRADQVARSARFAQISAEEDAKAAVFAKSTRRNRGREADSTKKIADTAFNESEKVARAARDAQTTREQIAAEQEKTLRLAREANARAQNSTSATATDSTSSTTRRATLPAQPTTAATNRAADKPERTTVVVPAPVVNVTPVVAPAPVVRVTVTGDGGDVSDVTTVAPASTSSTRALAVGAVESVQPVRKRKKKKPAPDPAPAPAPRGEPPAVASARAARETEETKKTNDVLAKVAKAAVQPKPATTPPPAPAPAPVPPRVVPAPAPAPAPAPRRPQPAPARAQFLPPPLPFAAPPNVTPTQAETQAYLRALERRRQIARPSGRLPDFIAPPPGSTRDRLRGKSNAAQDDGDRGSIPLFPDDGRFLGIPLPGRANAELRAQKKAARLKQEQQQRARAAFFQQARPKRRDHDDLTPFNGFVDPPELANLPGQGQFPLIPSQSKKPIQGDTRLDRINQLREAVQRAIASGDHDAIARAQRLSSDAPTPPGAVPLRTGPTPLEQFNAAVAKRAQDEVDRTNRQTQSDLQALNRRFFAHPEQFSPRSQTPYLPSTREEMERANDAAGELPEPNYRKSISDDRFNSARKRRQRFALGSFFGFQQTRGQQNEPLVGRQRAVENPERPLSGTDAARRESQRIVGENRRRLGFPQDLEPFRRGAQIGRQADPPASRLQRFRDAIRKLPRDDRGSAQIGPSDRFLGIPFGGRSRSVDPGDQAYHVSDVDEEEFKRSILKVLGPESLARYNKHGEAAFPLFKTQFPNLKSAVVAAAENAPGGHQANVVGFGHGGASLDSQHLKFEQESSFFKNGAVQPGPYDYHNGTIKQPKQSPDARNDIEASILEKFGATGLHFFQKAPQSHKDAFLRNEKAKQDELKNIANEPLYHGTSLSDLKAVIPYDVHGGRQNEERPYDTPYAFSTPDLDLARRYAQQAAYGHRRREGLGAPNVYELRAFRHDVDEDPGQSNGFRSPSGYGVVRPVNVRDLFTPDARKPNGYPGPGFLAPYDDDGQDILPEEVRKTFRVPRKLAQVQAERRALDAAPEDGPFKRYMRLLAERARGDRGESLPIGPSDGLVGTLLGTRNVAASGVGFLRQRLGNPPVPPAPLTELTNRLLGQRTTPVRGAGRFEDLLRGTASPVSRAGFVPPPAVPAAALEPFTLAPRQRREPASATKAFSRELDHTYDAILGKYHEIDAAAGEHVRAVHDARGFLAPPLLPEAARKKQQLPVLTDGNQPGAQEPPAPTPPKRRVPGATGGGSAGGQPPNKPPTGGSGTPAGGDDEEEPKLSPQAKAARTRRDKAIREGEQIAAEAKAKHVQDGSLTQSDVLARLTDTAKSRLSAGLDAVANKKGILSNFQDAPRLHDLFGLNKQDFQAGKPDFVNPIDRTNLVPDQGANITEKTAINNRILGELRAIERELEAQEQATGQSAREAAAITEALRHQRAAAAAAAAAAPPPAPAAGAGGASGGKGGGQGGAGTGGAPPASGDDENTPPPLNTRSNQRRVSKRQLLANRDLLTEGSGPDQKLAEGVIPLSDKFVVDTRNGLKRLYQRIGVGFKEIAASTDAGTEYLTQIRKLPAAIRRLEAEARRIEREAQAAGGAAGGGAGGGGLGGGGGGGLVGGGRGGRGGGGGDEPQSILGNFLKGATSGSHYNGRGGGSQSIQGRLNGIALAAGTTAKYAVLGSAFYALQAAAAAAGAEILDFKDSYTELNIALNGALPDAGGDLEATQTTISRLADSASLAGTNVGEAMDQAASAVRAFKNTTADGSEASQKELEALGVTFATEASKIATISKTTLTDAGGNLKATALAFDIPVSGLSRITDVLAGAKQAGGGNEKDIGQGIASAAVAAKEAGFSLEETGVLISRIVAETDESGAAAATRFSKITAILGGSAGKTALIKLNDSLAPTQQIDTSADVKTQVQQLSQVYESLSEAQRQQLVNSLGGTANARELIVLLSSADDLIKKADQGFTGKGAEEYEKRLQDIRAVLTQIRGNIKNIIVALANTGVLAPFGLLIKDGLLPALELVRHLIEAFNLIPKPIRYTAFALAEVLAVLVAIRAVTARGGIKEFIGGVEEIVAPGRTVSRRANAAAKEAAEAAAQSAAGAAAGAAAQGAEGAAAGAAGAAAKAGRLGRLGRLGTLGRVGVGVAGVAGVLSVIALFGQSVYSAGQKVDEASGAFQKLSKAPKDFTVAALRDSSLNLATNAHQLNDASSGFFGTIANQQSDTGGTGILAKAATEEAQFQSQQATRLERAQAAARQERGTRLGDTIDLSTPESLSASLEGLQGAGRNATTQMRALLDAMDQLGTGTVTASNRLTELQRITISGQAGTAFQVNFNDSLAKQRETALDSKIVAPAYAGLGQVNTTVNKLKRGTGNIASFGIAPLLRRRDNKVGRFLRNDREDAAFDLGKINSQKLGKGITDVTNNFLRDKSNASIDTKAGKDGLKAIYLEFFKQNYPDIKPAERDALIADALQQTVAAYKSVAAPRADLQEKIGNALAAAPAAAQKAAEEAGTAAALGKGNDGQTLASAKANLATLVAARQDAVNANAAPARLEQIDQDIAAARVQVNSGLQGRAAQTQALTLSKIPQESTSARNQSTIDALNTQLGIDPKTGKRKFHYVDKKIASTQHYNEHTGKVDGVAAHTERTKVYEGTQDAGQRDEQTAALNDAIAAQQAQKVKDKAAKRRAKIDPRDEVGNAAADTKDAQAEFDRLKANGTKGEALDTAALNLTKAQQAEASTRVDAAIAQRNVNAIPESSLDTATRNLKDGQDHLKVLEKGSIAYNQQLAANVQAADQLAQAQLDVASIQRQLNIDLTNPVQVANEQVVTAKAALAKAKKDTSGKNVDPLVRAQVVGTAELNLRNAEANAESAAFSQFLSSADTAQQLGRISHKAYLALLQGRKDQIDAEIAGLKKNDPQRQLLQDESDKLALSIKSGSDALSGVFNIGDIKTPTPYEVRKAIQDKDFGTVLGSNPASSTSGNVTNDTSTKNVVLNGVPVDTILTMIQELFGLKVRSSGGRKK